MSRVSLSCQVAFDGSYRNRNHTAHSINVVCSLKLREQNNRGLRDAVFGMVTFGRHVGKSLQIDPVCVTSRQGRCPVHGDAQDFKERAHPPATASASVREAAQRLRNSNCYSGTCLTSPHSAPGTESVGVQVLLLTQLLEGWLPTMFAHDQDVGLGLLVRQVTNDAWECLDRSHVQVCVSVLFSGMYGLCTTARTGRYFSVRTRVKRQNNLMQHLFRVFRLVAYFWTSRRTW